MAFHWELYFSMLTGFGRVRLKRTCRIYVTRSFQTDYNFIQLSQSAHFCMQGWNLSQGRSEFLGIRYIAGILNWIYGIFTWKQTVYSVFLRVADILRDILGECWVYWLNYVGCNSTLLPPGHREKCYKNMILKWGARQGRSLGVFLTHNVWFEILTCGKR